MPELAELQQRFAAGLLDGGLDPVELFKGPGELAARRYSLYRGNLAANWDKALGGAFPVLRALVGDEFFHALARSYGRARRFEEGDLNRLGAGLADFLEVFEPVAAYPYLPDLARLEWAVHLAHYAADRPALAAAELLALDGEEVDQLPLRLRPGAAVIGSRFAIGTIWRAHQPEAEVPLPDDPREASRVLVYRPRWRAQVRELPAGEFTALARLADGAPLGAALEAAIAADPDFDPGSTLPRWIADALFLPLGSHQEN